MNNHMTLPGLYKYLKSDKYKKKVTLEKAAPDLLAALKGIIDLVPTDCQHEARAAIKAATQSED